MGKVEPRTAKERFYDSGIAFNDWCVMNGIVEEGVMCFSACKVAITKHQKLTELMGNKFRSGNNIDVERITITRKEWNGL